tara:strand:+ start:2106 stop:4004 length:1899 start_codon:yes stop_codon:yes gene_type:complete
MKNILFTLLMLLFSTQILVAQNLKRANHLFEKRNYIAAAELLMNEDVKSKDIQQKLGDCYYFNTQMKEASTWYKKLINNYENTIEPTYFYRYSQALKGINKFNEADKWLQKYNEKKQLKSNNTIETLQFFESLNSGIDRPYVVHTVATNSSGSDFGPAFYGDSIVFSSTRNSGELYDWNHQPYLDLFQAQKTATGDLLNTAPFSSNINTKMHESNVTFTKDGKTMYFTRNNFINGKKGRDSNKISHLKIYKSELINNKWTNITELPFNFDNYSIEHPALSSDEKQLYFASDMPGSIGSFDIFVVEINQNGTYGLPKNLGATINTEQREQFPFVSSTNNLYFASDGHFGLGGLDIFKSKISNENYSKPLNLSDKINSNLDDFSFIINEETETGYFSSNRKGGAGDDDIYRFTQVKKYYVKGVVQNKNNSKLLPGTLVTLFDEKNNTIAEMIVSDDAAYSFEIKNNTNYKVRGSRKLFSPYDVEFSTDNSGNINKNILLSLESYEDAEKKVVEENGKIQIKINPIYFDFNKWNIRSDAAIELENIISIMKKYPAMVIEIGAHTDCRGPEEYNLNLSHKRAKAVLDYITSQGIPTTNLKSVGYGEMQPLNHCVKEGICTEDEYDINRRCEFVILN